MKNKTPEVWVVWPTISPVKSLPMVDKWHELGYKVAILVNPPNRNDQLFSAERVVVQNKWKGFPVAANILCKIVPGDIVVVVGDDVYPDPNRTAEEIGVEFLKRFPDTYGVMQPIGDKFAWTHKCAVSPWIGRTFIERAYQGRGPFWEGYYHYFSDQELQEYATSLGIFQQREDLTQFHDHWQRKENPQRPPHLMEAKKKWRKDRHTFQIRKGKGWPND